MPLPAVVVTLVLVVVVGCAGPAPSQALPVDGPQETTASSVLREWDDDRAAAWAAGDAGALGALYAPGSSAGIRDVRSLRAYADRGLRVTGLRFQRLAVRVLVRQERLLRLEVVERLLPVSVHDDSVVRRLPAGQPTRRVIELRRVDGSWLVGRVETVNE